MNFRPLKYGNVFDVRYFQSYLPYSFLMHDSSRRLLDPEDVDTDKPDEKSIITYVSTLYQNMPCLPDKVRYEVTDKNIPSLLARYDIIKSIFA